MRWFARTPLALGGLSTDLHSHLLPGLDDGVSTLEEAEAIILFFQQMGYRKLITTPHVMSDFYRNKPQQIREALATLRDHLAAKNITMEVDAAAEYYLDEDLMERLDGGKELLTFGSARYLLFETNFITEPLMIKDFIFKACTSGYTPVLAHPERYLYLHADHSKAEDFLQRGVLFQLNINSLTGIYAKPAQKAAAAFIKRGWVHFLGSDCHSMLHAEQLQTAASHPHVQKALSLPLLNPTL